MPGPAAKPPAPVVLVCGEDEFAVKQRAKEVYQRWTAELGGMDHETLDASAGSKDEALKAIQRLREALGTLPFFGSAKVVWLRDCSFLGEERAAKSEAVTDALAELAQELKGFEWSGVRLLISAGKVDKRKVFFKAIDKIGAVEVLDGWSVSDRDWASQAEGWARTAIRDRQKTISEEALAELVSRVGPNPRQLGSEIEKLSLFVGGRNQITAEDVDAICTRNKTARAFAVGDALGDRDLPRLLRRLDEELWEMQSDRDKSEIGLLYGLVNKVRAMLLLKEMVHEGLVKVESDYPRFKAQLERIPGDRFPQNKKFNPQAMHPWMLHQALQHSKNYTRADLVRAMDLLLQCNQRLVSSGLDGALVLQHALVQIAGRNDGSPASRPTSVQMVGA